MRRLLMGLMILLLAMSVAVMGFGSINQFEPIETAAVVVMSDAGYVTLIQPVTTQYVGQSGELWTMHGAVAPKALHICTVSTHVETWQFSTFGAPIPLSYAVLIDQSDIYQMANAEGAQLKYPRASPFVGSTK